MIHLDLDGDRGGILGQNRNLDDRLVGAVLNPLGFKNSRSEEKPDDPGPRGREEGSA
jgi:hypothetical protein